MAHNCVICGVEISRGKVCTAHRKQFRLEKARESSKKYYQDHKEKLAAYRKEFYSKPENKARLAESQKRYNLYKRYKSGALQKKLDSLVAKAAPLNKAISDLSVLIDQCKEHCGDQNCGNQN